MLGPPARAEPVAWLASRLGALPRQVARGRAPEAPPRVFTAARAAKLDPPAATEFIGVRLVFEP
jgi:hypothetical protein